MSIPHEGQAEIGRMVREAVKRGVTHDISKVYEENAPHIDRINDIQTGEWFLSILAEDGCMIVPIPGHERWVNK